MGNIRYKVNGDTYDIAEEESKAFEKDFPKAKVLYQTDNGTYEIGLNERDDFLADVPSARYWQKPEEPKPTMEEVQSLAPVAGAAESAPAYSYTPEGGVPLSATTYESQSGPSKKDLDFDDEPTKLGKDYKPEKVTPFKPKEEPAEKPHFYELEPIVPESARIDRYWSKNRKEMPITYDENSTDDFIIGNAIRGEGITRDQILPFLKDYDDVKVAYDNIEKEIESFNEEGKELTKILGEVKFGKRNLSDQQREELQTRLDNYNAKSKELNEAVGNLNSKRDSINSSSVKREYDALVKRLDEVVKKADDPNLTYVESNKLRKEYADITTALYRNPLYLHTSGEGTLPDEEYAHAKAEAEFLTKRIADIEKSKGKDAEEIQLYKDELKRAKDIMEAHNQSQPVGFEQYAVGKEKWQQFAKGVRAGGKFSLGFLLDQADPSRLVDPLAAGSEYAKEAIDEISRREWAGLGAGERYYDPAIREYQEALAKSKENEKAREEFKKTHPNAESAEPGFFEAHPVLTEEEKRKYESAITSRDNEYYKRYYERVKRETGSLPAMNERLWREDTVDKMITAALEKTGGDKDKAIGLLRSLVDNPNIGEQLMNAGLKEMATLKPTKGFGSWLIGQTPFIVPSAIGIALTATGNPYATIAGATLQKGAVAAMTISSAGQAMARAKMSGASDGQIFSAGLADALVFYTAGMYPYNRYVQSLLKTEGKEMTIKISKAIAEKGSPARKELEKLVERASKAIGAKKAVSLTEYLADMGVHGATMGTMSILQQMIPMIYEDPSEYPTLMEIAKAGAEGVGNGVFFGSVLGAVKMAGNAARNTRIYKENLKRWKENGEMMFGAIKGKDGKYKIVEIVGHDPENPFEESNVFYVMEDGVRKGVFADEFDYIGRRSYKKVLDALMNMNIDEAKQNGRGLETPQEKNDARNMYERQVKLLEEKTGKSDLTDEEAAEIITDPKTPADVADTVQDFANAKATYEGMIDKADERIERAVTEAGERIDGTVNRETGTIIPAVTRFDGKKVYVIGGKVVMKEDGVTIDYTKSDKEILIKDDETGEQTTVPVDMLERVDEALDPAVEKQNVAEAMRERLTQEEADRVEGVLEFNANDVYTLLTPEGKESTVMVVPNAEGETVNKNGTVNVVVDGAKDAAGNPVVTQVAPEQLQQMADAYNIDRLDKYLDEVGKQRNKTEEQFRQEEQAALEEAKAPKDFRGNRIPQKEDGSIDQNAFFAKDPEAWAKWNDERRQDGGENSRKYVEKALKRLDNEAEGLRAKAEDLRSRIDTETDFDKLEPMERELAETEKSLKELGDRTEKVRAVIEPAKPAEPIVEGPVKPVENVPEMPKEEVKPVEEKVAEKPAETPVEEKPVIPETPKIETPKVEVPKEQIAKPAERLTPAQEKALEMTGTTPKQAVLDDAQRKLNDIDSRIKSATSKAEIDGLMDERAAALQEEFDRLGAENTTVYTRNNIAEAYEKDGAPEEGVQKLQSALARTSARGEAMRGFNDLDKVYINANDIKDAKDGIKAQRHEDGHRWRRRKGVPREAMVLSEEEAKSALRQHTRTDFYDNYSHRVVIDEVLSVAEEFVEDGGVEKLPEALKSIGINNEKFVNFAVKYFENGRQISRPVTSARDIASVDEHPQVNGGQDDRNPRPESGRVEGEGARPVPESLRRDGRREEPVRGEVSPKPASELVEAAKQEGVASISDVASLDNPSFSIATEADVEKKIREFAKSDEARRLGWDEKTIEGIISETSDLINAIHASVSGDKYYDEWAKKTPTVKVDWRDGVEKPIVTWSRGNIDYKYDMSADLLCINNEGLETVLASPTMADLMLKISSTTKEGFSSDDYIRLYETLRDMGFVVPCKGCFDAAMRLKMLPPVAQKFVDLVNKTIKERNQNPQKFDEELKALAGEDATIGGLPISAKNKEMAVRIGVAGDKLTEPISWPQLMSAEGQTKALTDWGGVFRAWQRPGAGRPKDKLLPEPWSGEIVSGTTTIIGKYGEKTPSYRDINVNQGTGLRRNSHSEFRPILAIDEIQFMREAFLRGLTVFKYMKELDDVRLFGNLGVKFNMSFFPAFDPKSPVAGLDANGNYIAAEESVGGREFPYKGEDGQTHYDGMKGWEEAQKYVSKDVSLSSVVFSIPHLIKALTDVPTPKDPTGRWGSLIPYHATGATHSQIKRQGLGDVRALGGVHGFDEALTDYGKGVTNFEAVQNDRFGDGWTILEGKKAGTDVTPGHKLEFTNGTHYYNKDKGVHLFSSFYILDSELKPEHYDAKGKIDPAKAKKDGHEFVVDYNDKVREIGTDTGYKDATDFYDGFLREIGLLPRFDFEVPEQIFLQMCKDANVDPNHPKVGWRGPGNPWSPADSDAHYALWCDYGMTDPATGKWAPHNPVGMIDENGNRVFKLPDNAIDIIREGIARYSGRRSEEESRVFEAIEEFTKRSVEAGKLKEEDAKAILDKAREEGDFGPSFSVYGRNVDEESEKLFDAAKERFGVTRDIREAGYVLPDGTMLDFSGRHWSSPGQDTSWMNGMRQVDHRDIADLGYERDGNTPTGIETDMSDFIRRGAIRINMPGSINLSTKPTWAQQSVLERLINADNSFIRVDFGDGYHTKHFADYDNARPQRILNDIDRYFDEGIKPEGNAPMFSVTNRREEIFFSNAEKAVEDIKMEKATPEQWLKMIEKGGGLKAGEDKWIGLSDWLKTRDRKTITKQEIADYINQNKIRIEETKYKEYDENGEELGRKLEAEHPGFYEAFFVEEEAFYGNVYVDGINDLQAALDLYNREHENKIEWKGYMPDEDYKKIEDYGKELLRQNESLKINRTRLEYTTPGLENKREIALTVPSIEPWNEDDTIHFGDAGEGRAVAWIRFGDTTTADVEYGKDASAKQEELRIQMEKYTSDLLKKYRISRLNDLDRVASREELKELDRLQREYNRASRANTPAISNEKRVLVIDEIQSKRHQEGRDQGYVDNKEKERRVAEAEERFEKANKDVFDYVASLRDPINPSAEEDSRLKELKLHRDRLFAEWRDAQNERFGGNSIKGVPDAPFEKNWHELAMKRMLRYAADNGYDAIAWTTGEQQAERYDLGGVLKKISVTKYKDGDWRLYFDFTNGTNDDAFFNSEGIVIGGGQFQGKHMSEVVGKEIASRIMSREIPKGVKYSDDSIADDYDINGEGLRIGGEGMRGFYDDILPRFMNKYGKKWGVKVEDTFLPGIGKTGDGLTMHSVPVTDEMRASVLDGQPMFSVRGDKENQDSAYLKAVEEGDEKVAQEMVRDAFKSKFPDTKVVDKDGKPKVVYHGTLDEFNVFERGKTEFGAFHFSSTKEGAQEAALNRIYDRWLLDPEDPEDVRQAKEIASKRLRVIPAFLNIERLERVDDGLANDIALGRAKGDLSFGHGYVYSNSIEGDGEDSYMVFNSSQIKSAEAITRDDNGKVIPLSERFNSEEDDIRFSVFSDDPAFSIIGEQGAEVLDKEDLTTKRKDDLKTAEEMEKGKYDAITIKLATGWERGADGKWRYEVGDIKVKSDIFDKLKRKSIRLGDLVEPNSEALKAYPQIADYPVKRLPGTDHRWGVYSRKDNSFGINLTDIAKYKYQMDNVDDTINHEVQHAIQDIEGFARGAGSKEYWRTPTAQKMASDDPTLFYFTDFFNKHSAKNLMQIGKDRIERALRGTAPATFSPARASRMPVLADALGKMDRYEFNDLARRMEAAMRQMRIEANDLYNRSAGEVEARNTEKRMGMTPDERRNSLLSDTEDVAREEQDVRFSIVNDKDEIARLEATEKVPGYRTVVKNPDGSYSSPMAGELGEVKGKNRKTAKTPSFRLNEWMRSEENPDLVDENGKIRLIKPKREGMKLSDIGSVDYNPYQHLRLDKINRQFKDAWRRDDLVYVKSLVPKEEVQPADGVAPYHAEKAALSVGIHPWTGGALMLSRWDKPVEEVSWEEVANDWANDPEFRSEGVHFDIVPPQMRDMLTERGIKILPPHNGMGKDCNDAYLAWKNGNTDYIGTDTKFSVLNDKPVEEIVNEGEMEIGRENQEAKNQLSQRMNSINADLDKLLQAASAQRNYDRATVKSITDLAQRLMSEGAMSKPSQGEVRRLLSVARWVNGQNDIKPEVDRLMDIMVDNQLRHGRETFDKLIHIRGSKVSNKGVEVQGKLDIPGQKALKAFKTGIEMEVGDPETLENGTLLHALAKAKDDLESKDSIKADNAKIELPALELALDYAEKITKSKTEERGLRNELKDADEARRNGELSRDAYREFVDATMEALRRNKMDRVEAYRQINGKIAEGFVRSIEGAKLFNEKEIERTQQIHHYANSDLEGIPTDEHSVRNDTMFDKGLVAFLFQPLGNFDQMLRQFGSKSITGEGYLWNHFMRGWENAAEKEFVGFEDRTKALDDKVSEVFGKKMLWSDLYAVERKMPTVEVKFWDGGEMKKHQLTQGNLLYIYMVNKMSDGRMKLRRMGIEQEHVDAIKDQMDSRFIKLADWLQDEYLPGIRNEYNKVHEEMFGAPMASIDNYFPLKINPRSRHHDVDLSAPEREGTMSTTTGSVIKRTRNALALDLLNADAFSVVIEHLEQMEHWAAFAQLNKDINTLMSYGRFRNRVQNMKTIYGSGKNLLDSFYKTAQIAVGTYQPASTNSKTDKLATNIAKGVSTAKVNFRVFTAMKQLLSMPAFFSDVNPFYWGHCLANPEGSWNWAYDNLPLFRKRWKSRQAGDTRLLKTEDDWKVWRKNFVEGASRIGMSPNAAVDGMTIAIGARAVYMSRKAKYLKDGYTEDLADKRAKEDATILYNETQQSSEGALVSAIQIDRTWAASALSVFRNSSMGYTRQEVDAIRNIIHLLEKGNKEQSIEFMKKQMIRDGVKEEDAESAAKRMYKNAWFRNIFRVALFGLGVTFAWNIGGNLPYLVFGDDRKEKGKIWRDSFRKALVGGPFEGLAMGNLISEGIDLAASGEGFKNFNPSLMPISSDIERMFKLLSYDEPAAVNEIANIVVQALAGVNLQTATDVVVAIYDACGGDLGTMKEISLALMRILQMPQSQLDKIYLDEIDMTAEKGLDLTIEEFAKRYANYKVTRGTPLTGWMYPDAKRKKREDAYIKRFKEMAKERRLMSGNEMDKALLEWTDIGKTLMQLRKEITDARKAVEEEIYEEPTEEEKMTITELAGRLAEFEQSPEWEQYKKMKSKISDANKISKKLAKANTKNREELEMELYNLKKDILEMVNKYEEEQEKKK